MKLKKILILVLSLFIYCFSGVFNSARANRFIDIGVLTGGQDAVSMRSSLDNSIVVGYSMIEIADGSGGFIYPYRAFKYSNGVMENLGVLTSDDSGWSYAYDVSADGSMIVGASDIDGGNTRAFKYSDGIMEEIGVLTTNDTGNSYANAISADGSVIVGASDIDGGDTRAFKYSDGIMEELGVLTTNDTGNSYAYDVSADGSVIVGYSNVDGGDTRAFKYSDGIMEELGVLTTSGTGNSYAYDISSDGSVIVGYSQIDDGSNRAFKYSDGNMINLGVLAGYTDSYANSVSANGAVIVGYSDNPSGNSRAFKYQNGRMTDLGLLEGGTFSAAYGVSADGSKIFGSGDSNGRTHAFIYKNTLVDINNTYSALYQNGAQLNSVFNLKAAVLKSSLNQECDKFGKNGICTGVSYRYTNINHQTSQQQAADLRFAYRITPQIKVGAIIDQSFATNTPNNFVIKDYKPLTTIYTTFSQYDDGSGLRLKLAAADGKDNFLIKRDTLANTEAGAGLSNIRSTAFLGEVSYLKNISNKLSIRPFVGVRKLSISRSSYSETQNASFPISYSGVKQSFTTAIYGLESNLKIKDSLMLSFAAGLEDNFNRRMDGYSGSIDSIGSFSLKSPHVRRKNAFVSSGVSYDLKDNQRVSTSVIYGNQALNNARSAMVYLNYFLGF